MGNRYENAEGLWIAPDGTAIPVIEHLLAIAHEPEAFGLLPRDVKNQTVEGLRKIAERLIREGWVRYRSLSGDHLFEMCKLDKDLIDDVLTGGQALEGDRVIIETVSPKREYRGSVQEWRERSMLRSYETNPKHGWRLSR
jgi:hypothetical protein